MRKKKLNKRGFWDKFSYSNRNTNIFLVCVFLLLLFGLTIGYSVLSNVLSIKGDISVRPTKDIRITNVVGPAISGGAYETANLRFSNDLLVVNGVLPSTSSSLSYTVTIKNNGSEDMDLVDIVNSCNDSNVYYEVSGFNLGDTIKAGESATITVILKTNVGSNNAFASQLQFEFEQSYIDITAPTIAFTPMPTDSWSNTNYTVRVNVTDDIDVTSLMYCKSDTGSCTPTIVSTVDSFDVTIDASSDKNIICVLASDSSKYGPNSATLCTNKDGKYYKLDKDKPTINPTITGTTGNNGWYTSNVVFKVNGYDGVSLYKGHKYQTSTDNGSNYGTLSDYTLNDITLSTECVNNKVKITGYDNALNASDTYTSDTIKIDKTAPTITVDGHTSNFSTEYIYNGIYANGTPIYFNPVSGEICDDYVAENSLNNNKTGCMKWYIFNDESSKTTVDMILDHNTTKSVNWHSSSSNATGPSTILTQLHTDTDAWTGVPSRTDTYTDPLKGYEINYNGYRARLIEANEIAKITGADKALQWDSGKPYGTTIGTHASNFYLDGKYGTSSTWQTQVATSQGASKYAWLYDYTSGCTSYGCNIADSSGYLGYWTSSASASSSYHAWDVDYYGHLRDDYVGGTDSGLRPVITIDKDLVPLDVPMVADENAIYEIPTGTATDNCSTPASVTKSGSVNTSVLGSYPINYTTTDEAGNSKTVTMTVNVVDKTAPKIRFNPEPNNEWSKNNYQVIVAAIDDIEVGSLLWCQTTGNNSSCTPTTVGTANGTTIDINTDSDYHVICVQATDTSGNITTKCSNETGNYYKLDKTAPIITVDGHTSDYSVTPNATEEEISKTIELAYTGSEQIFTAPIDGQYEIDIAGAEGSVGNTYGQTTTLTGGKGANLKASFELNAGDILHVVVGGQGTATSNTSSDGTSGGGGGGTFIFKEIDTITDSNYQFTKNGQNYEVLLVAAGGGGTGDIGYSSSYRTIGGYDGVGDTWYSPDNIVSYSTQTANGTSSTSLSNVLGISQYISYNLVGGYYKRGSGTCQGGYGGGGCADDQRSYGGGWSGSSYKAYSFSSGTDTTGTTGANTGNGYATISYTGISIVLDFEIPEGTATDNLDSDVEVIRTIPDNYPHPGKNRITYTATDDAGNAKTLTLTVNAPDSTPPKIVFNPESDNTWHNTDYQVNVSATDDSYGIGSLLWCQTTGENATCTPTTVGDPTGTTIDIDTDSKYHVICVQASDESNNITTQCSNAEGNYYVLDKTAPVLTVDGHTSDYSVEFIPEEIYTYENGTPVYFNPVSGEICEDYVAANSLNNNKTGCMRWYIFNDDGKSTVDMILDHNTTKSKEWVTKSDYVSAGGTETDYGTYGKNDLGPITLLGQLHTDTDAWTGVPARTDVYTDPLNGYEINYSGYRARLIEANEIAKITGADKALQWNSGKPYADTPTIGTHSSWFYLDGKYGTNSTWQTQVATSQGASKYAWLFDYTGFGSTNNCTSYGCNMADTSGYAGYWTSSASADLSAYAWYVRYGGSLSGSFLTFDGDSIGLRPVITIDRSLIPDDTPMVRTLSTFEVPEATATDNFDNDVDITVTGAENASNSGTNNVVYKATDDAGNVKTLTLTVNVTDKVLPSISFEPEAEDEWTNSNYQVKVSATDDLAVGSLLWCQTTGKDATCTPTTVGSPSGTMVDINTENEYHVICAQASDTTGNLVTKCSNDGGKYYKLDKTAPSLSVDGKTSDFSITPSIVSASQTVFDYSGDVQKFVAPASGNYRLQVWGAQGGSYDTTYHGGKGGYSEGTVYLTEGTELFIYVGGKGTDATTSGTYAGGFNGGGQGYSSSTSYAMSAGGGATDIRIGTDSLYSRVIVAGGGGGAGSYSSSIRRAGGAGGGNPGGTGGQYSSSYLAGTGGTYSEPGKSYYGTTLNSTSYGTLAAFGVGAGAKTTSYIAGGGGGWYGGGYARRAAGGGGSGYVYTADTASYYPDGCLLNSSYYLSLAKTIAGSESFVSPTGGTETGHEGNGYAKITYIEFEGSLNDGGEVYFNPVGGNTCGDYVASNSNEGVKTGCMKWYVLRLGDTVDLLLDHNTSTTEWNNSGSNFEGPTTALQALSNDTSGWSDTLVRSDSYTDPLQGYNVSYDGYKARFIEPTEIAKLVGQSSWNSTSPSADFSLTNHSWLYNNGSYWTVSAYDSSDYAWKVDSTGILDSTYVGDTYGIRPVITVDPTSFATNNLPTGVATDNYDDDVEITTTGSVDYGTPGSYPVTYTATDDAGNSTSIVVTVVITQDKIAPTIVVNGKSTSHSMDVRLNDTTFVVPTATVTDNSGENLTVTTSGDVTVSVEGTYNVTYTATDSAGNTTNLVLTVNVAPVRANQLEYTNATNTSCSQAQCVIDELFSLLQ